ncbi:NAD(P)-binding domain-containing protein [Rothia nasimurium]|uniref:NAD(P)-binding domain-containing protein n=1 Tax=Rothia nasimurium TaxID=85336 RepID=UPI001F271AD0|nr:NAD(P)-binding domain-containing protein [Rothia nasimurium]
MNHMIRQATVIVIGGGQAGLSASYHLAQRGYANALTHPTAPLTYITFDAAEGPGGAWRHRWDSLTMATVNNIFDLPDFPRPRVELTEPSKRAIPSYFADFEAAQELAIARPVAVLAVTATGNPGLPFELATTNGTWQAAAIINATGTWNNPILPAYPGQASFQGRQLHTRDYLRLEDFTGQRVAIVGGGISAVQQLEEISRVATTFWYTRREPVFRKTEFNTEYGRDVVARVTADAEAGIPTGSVVSYTGLGWTPYARAAKARGALNRRPMFGSIDATGVIEADGSHTDLDAILWATGFKPALAHLDPLGLRNELGAIQMDGTQVATQPRLHLIGYGPSQSTVGANRAGRIAVRKLHKLLTR